MTVHPITESFFHLADLQITDQACQGTACFLARHLDPATWKRAEHEDDRIYCVGRCYAAPATASGTSRPRAEVDAPEGVVLGGVAAGGVPDLGTYSDGGGYAALEQALRVTPEVVVGEIEASGLRGRGGAGFPTGRKWRAVLGQDAPDRYVVCNADEGDPGAYIDRFLLEDDPHRVLEGLAIAAAAVRARKAYVYVRKEYPQARAAIERAVAEASGASMLGNALDVEVVEGKGSYVCGEETALLNALEGRRPEVRARPPYPAERGLFGAPTLVQNVETLAAIPWILRHGGRAYAAMGTATSPGTKVVSLSSQFRRPGLYEVELGLPVRDLVERLGGGLATGKLRGVLIGGPLAGILPAHLLDTRLAIEELRAVGCDVGHGGIVAIDGHTSIPELVHHVFRFGATESCGKCTPCRVGAIQIEDMLATALAGGPLPRTAGRDWRGTIDALAATSLCGHGTGLAAFARGVMIQYGEELDRWLG